MRRASCFVIVLAAFSLLQAQTLQRPAITGVAFARFYTTDSTAAQKFYGDTLGLHRIETGDTWVYAVNSTQWVELLTKPVPPETNLRMAAVGFTTRDAAALERYLAAHGVKPETPLQAGQFAVRDPEGNLVIFVQSGSNEGIAHAPTSPDAVSKRIIHVGFVVRDAAKEDAFWKQLLGFRPYWHGGMTDNRTDWSSSQAPEGSDWLEYMLNISPTPSLKQAGVQNHFSLGVAHMPDAIAQLEKNGCKESSCTASKVGRDGKVQVNLYDPDFTRAELMEFVPVEKPCCSAITGKTPGPAEDK